MRKEVKVFTIKRHKQPDLRFKGVLIGQRSEYIHEDLVYLALYQTQKGEFVCERRWHYASTDTPTRHVEVCESTNDIIDFYGTFPMSMAFYRDVGIECVEEIF